MAKKKNVTKQEKEIFLEQEDRVKHLLLDQAVLLKVEGSDELLTGKVQFDQIDFDALRQESILILETFDDDTDFTVGVDATCFGVEEAYTAFKDDPEICGNCGDRVLCDAEVAIRSKLKKADEPESKMPIKDVIDETEVSAEIVNEEKKIPPTEAALVAEGLVNPYRSLSITGVAFALLANKPQSLESLVKSVALEFPQKSEAAIKRAINFIAAHGQMRFALLTNGDILSLISTVAKES
ncbi:hypothetical protein KKF45_05680 [Patescibacteria group bacterium]|nr:hypothetical protein [Patescibacteria group bacterium]